jgi:hypothetical protein
LQNFDVSGTRFPHREQYIPNPEGDTSVSFAADDEEEAGLVVIIFFT